MAVTWNDKYDPPSGLPMIPKDQKVEVSAWYLYVACSWALEKMDEWNTPPGTYRIIFHLIRKINPDIWGALKGVYPAEYFVEDIDDTHER